MSKRASYLYCRGRAEIGALWGRLSLREALEEERGLSNLATTVILVAVGVALVVAVVAILGPAIMNLAERTGANIESVPMDWGGQ